MPDGPLSDPRVPVTLLTGFLGSGKTTLLNALLRSASAGRVAVIINEFGDIGLDHDLIEAATEEMVLMESGCLCCSIRGDLVRTMSDLARRRVNGLIAFDRVVIETTGLADPAPIQQTLIVDPTLTYQFLLDGVVTLVDAAAGMATLDRQFEAISQIAVADRIVLSKGDLVDATALAAITDRVQAINPTVETITTAQVAADPGMLFDIGALRSDTPVTQALAWTGVIPPAPVGPEAAGRLPAGLSGLFAPRRSGLKKMQDLAHAPEPQGTIHDSRITSLSAVIDEPVDPDVFGRWIDTLMWLRGSDILRFKAIIHTTESPHPFAVHGVQHIFYPPVPLPHWPADDRVSRFVLIGRDLRRDALEDSLTVLRARPAASRPDTAMPS
jgi:G3E family GTPase